jgi:hypothetical protein
MLETGKNRRAIVSLEPVETTATPTTEEEMAPFSERLPSRTLYKFKSGTCPMS